MKASEILMALLCAVIVALMVAGAVIAGRYYNEQGCNGMTVEVSGKYAFVDKNEAVDFILSRYGDPVGMKAGEIDLWQMEQLLDSHSAVFKSQVWLESDNCVHIDVMQRCPVMRIQTGNSGFYIDSTGCIFPLQKGYSAQVPVIDGNVPVKIAGGYKGLAPTPEEQEWVERMLELITVMRDGVWATNISQIRVGRDGSMVMVPRTGNEKILFGSTDDIERKFAKIEKYYTHILPLKGEGYYRSVDVTNKGKIICRK